MTNTQKATDEASKHYDIVVLGAGIQGAGIAQACALNGLSVLLLEQFATPAMGTSSKSSKLIHGGLRYLESFSFALVRECLLERKYLLQNASSIVTKNRFFIPLYKTSKRHPWVVYMGLWLYAWLAGDFLGKTIGRVKQSAWENLNGLNKENLQAVFYYEDAQTDDKALTERVIASAQKLGAHLVYNRRVTEIKQQDGMFFVSTEHTDVHNKQHDNGQINKQEQSIYQARVCINVTGPWVNTIARNTSPLPNILPIELVQGTHIVLDRQIATHCFYGESPDDGRATFVLPWKNKTMVGTTELALLHGPETIGATEPEVDYLLRVVNHMFPREAMTKKNISETFAGSRVLPREDGNLNARTRETQILFGPECPQYFAVYGGKLTAYRAVAESVLRLMVKETNLPIADGVIKTTRDVRI